MNARKVFSFLPTLLLLLGLSEPSAIAQTDAGSISGIVHDSSGAAVPHAKVTLKSVDTGLVQDRAADDQGVYVFSPVKIGTYQIMATAAGFSTTVQDNVQLHVQQSLALDLSIRVGAVSETVNVSTAPPLLQTEDSSTGQVVGTREINATPLNGRNWIFIAQLTSGVAPSNGSRGQSKGDFSANGQRPEQNNFILDGVDNNTSVVDFLNGASFVVRPPPDALAEFKVQTGNYSAEFGHSAGAVVNASLKSGTNAIHGDLWEYIRNDAFDIHDFGATTVSKYRQNQFGATLGLPVLKNKLFFFGDVEANRIVFGEPGTYTVPTDKMRTGDFSELLNTSLTGATVPTLLFQPGSAGAVAQSCNGQANVFCQVQISPIAQRLLNLYPLPNYNSGKTYSNYFVARNSNDNTWQFDTRIDWNPTEHDQAFARFSYINEPAFHPSPLGQILDGGTYGDSGSIKNFGQNFMMSETHSFTSSLVNEFRFGYNWGHFRDLQPNANTDISSQLGLGGVPYAPLNGGLPSMSIGGITALGATPYYPANEYENVFQILDNVTKIFGGHAIKAGLSLQHLHVYTLAPPNPRGSYNYSGKYTGNPSNAQTGYGAADFLVDQMNSAAISTLTALDQMRWVRSGYFQDDWHASSKLTVNLGLRYEFFQPQIERHGHQSRFDVTGPLGVATGSGVFVLPMSQQGTALPQAIQSIFAKDNVTVQYSSNASLLDAQRFNFAPRFGLAYQVSPKLVVRTGFGIFFGGLESVGADNLGFNYPFQFTSGVTSPNCTTASCPTDGITLATGFASQIAAGLANSVTLPSLIGQSQHPKTTYTEQFNLTTEYSLSNNLVATLGYAGSVGRHLISTYNKNGAEALIAPGLNAQAVRPFPDIGSISYINDGAVNSYNSLQAKLEKRFAAGLSFLASYTFSHTLDNAPSPLGSTGDGGYRSPNLAGIGIDYGNSVLDVRQRVTLNGMYELPFGHGKPWLNRNGVASYLLGGWSGSLLFRAQAGNPFTITANSTTANGLDNAFAVRIGDPYASGGSANSTNPSVACPAQVKTTKNWFNPCAFANPLSGSLITGSTKVTGNATLAYFGGKRNQIYTPGYNRTDMSLFKSFAAWREQYLQFRADVFNIFNTPAYGFPIQAINSNAGLITGTRSLQQYTPDSRFFQFALKYVF